jgi:hypothetical protein
MFRNSVNLNTVHVNPGGRLTAGIAVSNPVDGMAVTLLCSL